LPVSDASRVQFLAFDGCPLAVSAREVLKRALIECGLDADHYEEIDIMDAETSDEVRAWGSPTILVNGADVSGVNIGNGASCRIYDTPDRVPEQSQIVEKIKRALKL
jgi:hypothetical protein